MTSQYRYITHCPQRIKSEGNNRTKLRDNRKIYIKIRNSFRAALPTFSTMVRSVAIAMERRRQAKQADWSPALSRRRSDRDE
jgi:hypothetical protein